MSHNNVRKYKLNVNFTHKKLKMITCMVLLKYYFPHF